MTVKPSPEFKQLNEDWGFGSMQAISDAMIEKIVQAGPDGSVYVPDIRERAIEIALENRRK